MGTLRSFGGDESTPLSHASPLCTVDRGSLLGNSGVPRAHRPGVLSGVGMFVFLHPAGFSVMQPTHKEKQPGGKERAAFLVTGECQIPRTANAKLW